MKKVYVNGIGSISTQKTFDNNIFLDGVINYHENVLPIIEPDYKDYIPAAAARRMAKGIKMGVVSSKIAMSEAEIENVDAILTGTGLGCVRDSEKFVSTLIDHQEEYLTPTSFIQSTHNTVGGQIALGMQCKGYNFTYVHASNSFESCLFDAKLMLENDESTNVLIGGVDEVGEHTIKIHHLINHIKVDKVDSSKLLSSKSKGAVFSEGANFFVLSNHKSNTSYCEVVDVQMYNTLSENRLSIELEGFLNSNQLSVKDIDLIVLGNNGDVDFDTYYEVLTKEGFKNIQQAYYKHLSGEYYTASSFGLWLASKILKAQTIPDVVKLNAIEARRNINNVLLYNQYRGENHSFTLLKKC